MAQCRMVGRTSELPLDSAALLGLLQPRPPVWKCSLKDLYRARHLPGHASPWLTLLLARNGAGLAVEAAEEPQGAAIGLEQSCPGCRPLHPSMLPSQASSQPSQPRNQSCLCCTSDKGAITSRGAAARTSKARTGIKWWQAGRSGEATRTKGVSGHIQTAARCGPLVCNLMRMASTQGAAAQLSPAKWRMQEPVSPAHSHTHTRRPPTLLEGLPGCAVSAFVSARCNPCRLVPAPITPASPSPR
jgi:hypothetical protein